MRFRDLQTARTRPAPNAAPETAAPAPEGGAVLAGTVGQSVLVNYGIHAKSFPVVGMTVAQARRTLAPQLNLDPQAVAVIRGEVVENEESRVIEDADQMVSFVKKSSVKGS